MGENNLEFVLTKRERISYSLRRVLMRIACLPGMARLSAMLQKLGTQIENFHRLAQQQKNLFDAGGISLGENAEKASSFQSGFGYEDEYTELKAAAYYRAQIMAGNLKDQKTESGALYEHVIATISERLSKGDIKTVLNFGFSYAHVDSELAKKFPDIQFVGLERSALTKIYNENIFGGQKNLTFIADDIFNHLSNTRYPDTLFLHIRTLTLLPENFVNRLYKEASASGCTSIAGFEQCGISYETNQPYDFDSTRDKPSVNFRSTMFIHNYPGKAAELGYELDYSHLLKTNHPDPTYRIASFISNSTRSPH